MITFLLSLTFKFHRIFPKLGRDGIPHHGVSKFLNDELNILITSATYRPSFIQFIWDSLAVCSLYWILYSFLYQIHRRYLPWFREMKHSDQLSWCIKVVSTLHAIVASFFTISYFLYAHSRNVYPSWEERLYLSHSFLQILICHTTGYMIYDTAIIVSHPDTSLVIFLHHLSFLFGVFFMKYVHLGFYLMAIPQATELTTINLHLRWFLAVRGRKGFVYKVNAFILWSLWIIVRIGFACIYLGYLLFSDVYVIPIEMWGDSLFLISYLVLFIGLSIIIFLNVYWGYLLTSGIISALSLSNSKKKKIN